MIICTNSASISSICFGIFTSGPINPQTDGEKKIGAAGRKILFPAKTRSMPNFGNLRERMNKFVVQKIWVKLSLISDTPKLEPNNKIH